MASTSDHLKASAAFLTATNLVCAAIGAVQGLAVVRLLGPDAYGVAAVLVSLTAVAANLVDVRTFDLVSNLYYNQEASRPANGAAYRASALRLGIGLYALSAPIIALTAAALMFFGARHFSAGALVTDWFWMAAAAQGIGYFGSFFIYIQRFIMTPARMASLQIVSAFINAAAMLGCVIAHPTVGGYVTGLLVSACVIGTVNTFFAVRSACSEGIPLFDTRSAPTIDRRVVFRFIAAGNVLGYVKLLHRSADVLLVAFFCSDRDTGIYKLARSMTDALYGMSEAIGRIYQPRLLALLQEGAHAEFRRLARSIAGSAAVLTAVALAGVFLAVPRLGLILGWRDMPGLTIVTAVMTLPFLLAVGLQSWIWPAFVSLGQLGRCTFWGVIAVLAGQYTVGPLLVYATGAANPAWFAVGYLSFYILSLFPLWHELINQGHTFAWMAPEAA